MELKELKKNVTEFVKFIEPNYSSEKDDLRICFFNCLNKVQKSKFNYHISLEKPLIECDLSNPSILPIIKEISDHENYSLMNISKEEESIIFDKINLSYMHLFVFNKDLLEIINLIVGCYIIARKEGYGGASFSNSLGMIWLSPPKNWNSIDYAEAIFHETVHQCLYISEMVRGLFTINTRDMISKNILAKSAIRNELRPYVYSFHSACVSISIILFHAYFQNEEKIIELSKSLYDTLKDLRKFDFVLNIQGRSILKEIETVFMQEIYLPRL